MCDTDMVLPADTLDRLTAAADPAERPVVGALCFSLDKGEKLCTMYELTGAEPGRVAFTRYQSWPEDAVMRVSATGAACLLMHRDALEGGEKHAGDVAGPGVRETGAGPRARVGGGMPVCL